MLQGFERGENIVIIMGSCYGGGFTGGEHDIQESNSVQVIGNIGSCWRDLPFFFGAFFESFEETIADGAGEKEADSNNDGIVTAKELKNWLGTFMGGNHDLGQPDDFECTCGKNCSPPAQGRTKAIPITDDCNLPTVKPWVIDSYPGLALDIDGTNFAPNSKVVISLLTPDGITPLDTVQTDTEGSFNKKIEDRSIPDGIYRLTIEDEQGNRDLAFLYIFNEDDPSSINNARTERPLFVNIDIKPGIYPNPIYLGSRANGGIPVVIFSAPNFDATTINPSTIRLVEADNKLKGEGNVFSSVEDVNADGIDDLIVEVFTTGLELSQEETEAGLLGKTYDGRKIRGVDRVVIIEK